MDYPWESDSYKKSLSQYPKRVIDESTKNDILEEQSGQLVLIGHTLKWCEEIENTLNEATALAEKYYNLGIEHGYITPKKSTEDMLLEAMNAIKYLSDKIDKLESEKKPIIAETEVIENEPNRPSNKINKKSISENSGTDKK